MKKISATVSDFLNILRIIAAACVVLGHGFSIFKIGPLQDTKYFPNIQSLAVLVFFILSGFLTSFSLRKGKYTYKSFVINRFKRIYSFFIPSLLLIFISDFIWIIIYPDSYQFYINFNIITVIKNLALLPRIGILDGKGILSVLFYNEPFGSGRPFWTLFIEWWLYILYGYLHISIRKNKVLKICELFVCFSLAAFFLLFDISSKICVICFFFGVLINRFYKKMRITRLYSGIAIVFFAFLFIVVSIYKKETYTLEEAIIISGLILSFVLSFEKFKYEHTNVLLRTIAGITYPLYLIHYTVMEFTLNVISYGNRTVLFVCSCLISILISMGLYIVVSSIRFFH